jgi:hypothetical protein
MYFSALRPHSGRWVGLKVDLMKLQRSSAL